MTPVLVCLGDSSASFISSVASVAFSRRFPVASGAASSVFSFYDYLRNIIMY